jgi:hypothetical protein
MDPNLVPVSKQISNGFAFAKASDRKEQNREQQATASSKRPRTASDREQISDREGKRPRRQATAKTRDREGKRPRKNASHCRGKRPRRQATVHSKQLRTASGCELQATAKIKRSCRSDEIDSNDGLYTTDFYMQTTANSKQPREQTTSNSKRPRRASNLKQQATSK